MHLVSLCSHRQWGRSHRCRPWAGGGSTCQQNEASQGPAGWPCTGNPSALVAPPRPKPMWSSSSEGYSAVTQNTPMTRQSNTAKILEKISYTCNYKIPIKKETIHTTETVRANERLRIWTGSLVCCFPFDALPSFEGSLLITFERNDQDHLPCRAWRHEKAWITVKKVLLACKVVVVFDPHWRLYRCLTS